MSELSIDFGGLGSDVDLYWAAVDELKADEQEEIRASMSDKERKRCQSFRHEPSRLCYLVTRRLVRHTLSTLGGRCPGDWRFGTGDHGRPFLNNPTRSMESLDFNIAHSSRRVVLAITQDGRVGVDLEPVDRRVDHDLVARRFFHGSERRDLETLASARRRRRFLELWVLKEAWMKADGRGIGAGLNEVVFSFGDREEPELIALPDCDVGRWRIGLDQVDGHLIAVARRGGDDRSQLLR